MEGEWRMRQAFFTCLCGCRTNPLPGTLCSKIANMNNKRTPLLNGRVKLALTLCAMIAAVLLSSFVKEKHRDMAVQNLLDELGITPKQAQEHVWTSISTRYLPYAGKLKVLRKYEPAQQASAAKELLAFAKQYTESPEFAARYESFRQEHAPKAPSTAAEEMQKMVDGAKQGKANIEKSLPGTSGETKQSLEEAISMFNEQIRMYSDPKHPDYQNMKEMMEMSYTQSKKQYQDYLVQFEKDYPKAPGQYVKRKLQQFLQLSGTVDFAAELKDGPGGKKYFVKAEYEKKPDEWKKCFRAGKDAVTAARSFVTEWQNSIK